MKRRHTHQLILSLQEMLCQASWVNGDSAVTSTISECLPWASFLILALWGVMSLVNAFYKKSVILKDLIVSSREDAPGLELIDTRLLCPVSFCVSEPVLVLWFCSPSSLPLCLTTGFILLLVFPCSLLYWWATISQFFDNELWQLTLHGQVLVAP